ncbi:MAG: hypothetical protein PWP07_1289 [Epulopiscium sp.]|jgi:PAS domain S-box-containing protein|nr:domain S-box protein [Defluviitaleaceae bacterium]MDK2788064.1 hypothetical protein [Candidatus Epulonipiscium sp.]HHW67105.1 response regulator [Candidatus Epulonipiscium sp.]
MNENLKNISHIPINEAMMFFTSLDVFDEDFIGLTKNCEISLWSKGAEKRFGYKANEIIGRSIEVLIAEDQLSEFYNQMDLVRSGEIIKDFTTASLHKDGTKTDVFVSLSPVYDRNGMFNGAVGIYKDILEERKFDSYQFLSHMSHEIRNLISGIVGIIELFKTTPLDHEQSRYVSMLKKSIDKFNPIINKISEISNLESDKILLTEKSNQCISAKTILGVEDNIINQEIMESIIKRKGYHYIPAYNGKEAISILKNTRVNLILMDIQLPELDGFEVTRMIREQRDRDDHIPIIAMTAFASHEDRQKCIEAGMDDYISKPFELDVLYSLIEKYLY